MGPLASDAIAAHGVRDYQHDVVREFRKQEITDKALQRLETIKDVARYERILTEHQPSSRPSAQILNFVIGSDSKRPEAAFPQIVIPPIVNEKSTTFISKQLAHIFDAAPASHDAVTPRPTESGIGSFISKIFGTFGGKPDVASKPTFVSDAPLIASVMATAPSFAAPSLSAPALSAGILGANGILGFASGGEPPVSKWSVVGEEGPELFMPKVAGMILPNSELGGKRTREVHIHGGINVYVPQGTSRASADQIALAQVRRSQQALSKIG
jgi:hypothetical protein